MQVLNEAYSEQLKQLIVKPGPAAGDAAFISIDRLGTDVRVRFGTEYSVHRVGFDQVRRLPGAMGWAWLGLGGCLPPGFGTK